MVCVRARAQLYEKYLEYNPSACTTWAKYAELETVLLDVDRARAVYELAIAQPVLDMPELLWKNYIQFEVDQGEPERARTLYARLLERSQHVRIWISFALFEASQGNVAAARELYKRASAALRRDELKEERVQLLASWRDFEKEHGTTETVAEVERKMPMPVKRRRRVLNDDGVRVHLEAWACGMLSLTCAMRDLTERRRYGGIY